MLLTTLLVALACSGLVPDSQATKRVNVLRREAQARKEEKKRLKKQAEREIDLSSFLSSLDQPPLLAVDSVFTAIDALPSEKQEQALLLRKKAVEEAGKIAAHFKSELVHFEYGSVPDSRVTVLDSSNSSQPSFVQKKKLDLSAYSIEKEFFDLPQAKRILQDPVSAYQEDPKGFLAWLKSAAQLIIGIHGAIGSFSSPYAAHVCKFVEKVTGFDTQSVTGKMISTVAGLGADYIFPMVIPYLFPALGEKIEKQIENVPHLSTLITAVAPILILADFIKTKNSIRLPRLPFHSAVGQVERNLSAIPSHSPFKMKQESGSAEGLAFKRLVIRCETEQLAQDALQSFINQTMGIRSDSNRQQKAPLLATQTQNHSNTAQ